MVLDRSKSLDELKAELAEYCRRAFHRRLVSGTGGNLSIRVPDGRFLVTPSGVSLEDMTPELAIELAADGSVIQAPEGMRPSMETSFHLEAYRMRPQAGGLCHLHPPYATAFSNKGIPLPLATVSAELYLGQVPCIGQEPPGSPELCSLVCAGLGEHPKAKVLLMQRHGILAWGHDLAEAYHLADIVEESALIAFVERNIK